MENYLDYDDASDFFRWGGSINDLKKFIDEILEVDEDEVSGEIKEDKSHNAFTYKVNDLSVRFYFSV